MVSGRSSRRGARLVSPVPTELSVLRPFIAAGLFEDGEVQLVSAIERLSRTSESGSGDGGPLASTVEPSVLLAVAVTALGFRLGHVCIDMADVDALVGDADTSGLPWPDPDQWLAALRSAPWIVSEITEDHAGTSDDVTTTVQVDDDKASTSGTPLVLDGTLLYLQRHWVEERLIADQLLTRVTGPDSLQLSGEALETNLERFFGPSVTDGETDWQRLGAQLGLTNAISILAGGPGTGKTRTIARMLACLHTAMDDAQRRVLVAAAAPSGKAAARMGEAIEQAVEQLTADGLIDASLADRLRSTPTMTIHRLLRAHPRRGFGHDAENPLVYDMVIIDECSMIDLPLMAALLEAVPSTCHLVLVGDPDQLASVRAGTVLGDIVRPAMADLPTRSVTDTTDGPGTIRHAAPVTVGSHITVLRTARRFRSDSAIAALSNAVRSGEVDLTLAALQADRPDVDWIDPHDQAAVEGLVETVATSAVQSVTAARRGDVSAALTHLTSVKVLTAMHDHRFGQNEWTERIEARVFDRIDPDTIRIPWSDWYTGRPVMVTRNDQLLRISNGDTGTTIMRDGIMTIVFDGRSDQRHEVQAARLDNVSTWWAMTIHKSQGSEFDHVIVSLPMVPTRILTRELLYTAITRARSKVTIIGTSEMISAAVTRPISRASGLQERLWPGGTTHGQTAAPIR